MPKIARYTIILSDTKVTSNSFFIVLIIYPQLRSLPIFLILMSMTYFSFKLSTRKKPRQLSHPEISISECELFFNNK
jgi:hypothetical protein